MKYSDWLTKKQTADALGVSTKTVEKFASDKLLNPVMTKNPETGATIVKYHPREVMKLRQKRMPDAAPFVLPKDGDDTGLPARRAGPALLPAPNMQALPRIKELAEAMTQAAAQAAMQAATAAARTQAANVPLQLRLYLTRAEAARYSGLPQSEINLRIKSRELPAIRTGRGWRIRRSDLEQLQISPEPPSPDQYANLPKEFDDEQTGLPPTDRANDGDAIAEVMTDLGGDVRRY